MQNKLRYIIYCRKSTDSEDRQVQSLQDQREHLEKLRQERGLNVVKIFEESKSAKKAGRPLFNEMLQMIQNGEADGVICWKLNRLARNPIDGGQIQWLLQENTIKSIMTIGKEYLPTDNVLMMAVEFGMSTQFILDLSKDVKRGMLKKAKAGWRPGLAPIGYLNDKYSEKGSKKIIKDEEVFPLVRKMWDLFLNGHYTVSQIVRLSNEELGLRTRRGDKLSLSWGYKVLTNPFYYGEFTWDGETFVGSHEAMITKEEFDRVQKILSKKGKPRAKYKRLPFMGVIECGECGAMITADQKSKFVKSTQKTNTYLYHRCTKRKKNTKCSQKPIRHEELVTQIKEHLDAITIPKEFLTWAINVLRENNELEEVERTKIIAKQRKNYDNCLKRIDNLINLYISPDNADKSFLSEEEFKKRKNELVTEKSSIEAEIRKTETGVDDWLELTEKTFKFATYAKHWFDKGDFEKKTHILQSLGKNFYFKDGKLSIDLEKPYLIMKQGFEKNKALNKARLEPSTICLNNAKNSRLSTAFSQWSG